MAKIIAWLIVIFIVLLALRMINMRKARGRGAGKSAPAAAEPMVRCVRCTVYLPDIGDVLKDRALNNLLGDEGPIDAGY